MWRNLDSLKNRLFVLLQLSAWLSAFFREMMSVWLDMILQHLVSSTIKNNKASVTYNGKPLIKATNSMLP